MRLGSSNARAIVGGARSGPSSPLDLRLDRGGLVMGSRAGIRFLIDARATEREPSP
jgi:hypothetical protein